MRFQLLWIAALVAGCSAPVRSDGFAPVPGVYGTAPLQGFVGEPLGCGGAVSSWSIRTLLASRTFDHAGMRCQLDVGLGERPGRLVIVLALWDGTERGAEETTPSCRDVVAEPLHVAAAYEHPSGAVINSVFQRSPCGRRARLGDSPLRLSREVALADEQFRLKQATVGLFEAEAEDDRRVIVAPTFATVALRHVHPEVVDGPFEVDLVVGGDSADVPAAESQLRGGRVGCGLSGGDGGG